MNNTNSKQVPFESLVRPIRTKLRRPSYGPKYILAVTSQDATIEHLIRQGDIHPRMTALESSAIVGYLLGLDHLFEWKLIYQPKFNPSPHLLIPGGFEVEAYAVNQLG